MFEVVGSGAPGGMASSTPTPTIAAPATPVLIYWPYWRADVFDLRGWDLDLLDTVRNPPSNVYFPATRRYIPVVPEKNRLSTVTSLSGTVKLSRSAFALTHRKCARSPYRLAQVRKPISPIVGNMQTSESFGDLSDPIRRRGNTVSDSHAGWT